MQNVICTLLYVLRVFTIRTNVYIYHHFRIFSYITTCTTCRRRKQKYQNFSTGIRLREKERETWSSPLAKLLILFGPLLQNHFVTIFALIVSAKKPIFFGSFVVLVYYLLTTETLDLLDREQELSQSKQSVWCKIIYKCVQNNHRT